MISEIIDLPDIRTKLVKLMAITDEEAYNLHETSEKIKQSKEVIPIYSQEQKTLTLAIRYEAPPTFTRPTPEIEAPSI